MIEFYSFFKAFHIIGFVSWFAGLFYLVRMFVYHAEAEDKPASIREDWKKQFTLMQWRVYKIITTPAMVITWLFGTLMLVSVPSLFQQSWIWVKLVLLILLTIYHFYCKQVIKKLESGDTSKSSFYFRLLNEVPTLFLVAIVILAVVKDVLNFLGLFLGVMAFGVILFYAAKMYKNSREKNSNL